MLKLGERCKHGLYSECKCYICGLEKEITQLKAENERLRTLLPQALESTESPSVSGSRIPEITEESVYGNDCIGGKCDP